MRRKLRLRTLICFFADDIRVWLTNHFSPYQFFSSVTKVRGLRYIQFQRHIEKKFLWENVESYEIIKLMSCTSLKKCGKALGIWGLNILQCEYIKSKGHKNLSKGPFSFHLRMQTVSGSSNPKQSQRKKWH